MGMHVEAGRRKAAEVINLGTAFKAVPRPGLPLQDVALAKYEEVASMLMREGKLNFHTQAICESIGNLYGTVHRQVSLNRPASVTLQEKLERLYLQLRLIDESDESAPAAEKQENRFARFGIVTSRGAKKTPVPAPR